ncbi:3-demethylubiquinone-9 3-methyltransferase [Seminavis robusta]|uniref:3-demethylubiquinone-9 3-methyltransferase n=1 Tax=Seminavis robusta TaxID=568900 RepID=A0A9N8EAA1_9STRA|nr:3-demethylubiquinone-9 3-methyltransferase [Seminavis robusta]|eukprot:Sro855_g211360.1 3-demethylubiquinone-9 3-methyltransferase (163) ;mRNA; f:12549-13116
MKVHLYLTFDGNCSRAFDHYKEVFGTDIECKMTWGDNPHKNKSKVALSEEKANQIMHMSMHLTKSFELMGCDTPPEGSCCGEGMGHEKFVVGNNMQINLEPDSKAHADKLIVALASKGGKVMNPMEEAFWGSYFGMCKDPFGVTWMLNCPLEANKDEKKEED